MIPIEDAKKPAISKASGFQSVFQVHSAEILNREAGFEFTEYDIKF